MLEAVGNLWTWPTQVVVVMTNGEVKRNGRAVMGRGSALEARKRFLDVDLTLARYLAQYGNRCFVLLRGQNKVLVSFPTKQNWRDPALVDLIVVSAKQLVEMADKFGWKSVVLPRPGCGRGTGQLDWSVVKPLLVDVLDDRFTVVSWAIGSPSLAGEES